MPGDEGAEGLANVRSGKIDCAKADGTGQHDDRCECECENKTSTRTLLLYHFLWITAATF